MRHVLRFLSSAVLLLVAGVVHAQSSPDPASSSGFQTPVSPLGHPAPWLDSSRLHVTSEFMFGSSFSGPAQGLQVTRLQYQMSGPLAMSVSLGTQFGGPSVRGVSTNPMFLEGFDLSYHPFDSFLVQVHYQDVRSPLQLSSRSDYPFWR
jgi:hypothetical protein